ncbi:MAG: hypothetical protein K9H64_04880 [Bacteroidales bacterium]|nr:hypothetical protein [Bacteroidales bacterium]MCF8455171.1 hypothetical protein [Bacteroidales bacterium]
MKTLRNLTLIAIAVLTLTVVSNQANAQTADTDAGVTTLVANLNHALELTIDDAQVVFNFDELTDYINGVGAGGDITMTGGVEATCDWKLDCAAAGATLVHQEESSYTIPIDQVGLKGTMDGGYASNTSNLVTSIVPLTTDPINLFTTASTSVSNAGTDAQNAFTIYWEMGTGTGDMNGTSLFEANYRKGQYQQTVNFTLTEIFSSQTNNQ